MDSKQLEQHIEAAVKKVGAEKENDICHYLPSQAGGYMHHFTMRKMKTENPSQLAALITKYIIDCPNPQAVAPKQRAPRGTRKRRDFFTFSKNDLDRMLQMAHLANDQEMVRKLTPKKDLNTIKKELISSIRHNRVEAQLWNLYADSVSLPATAAV